MWTGEQVTSLLACARCRFEKMLVVLVPAAQATPAVESVDVQLGLIQTCRNLRGRAAPKCNTARLSWQQPLLLGLH